MKNITIAMALMASAFVGCTSNVNDIDRQVDELYNKMSQEERLAQICSMKMDLLFDENGQLDTAKCRELIPNGIGHFSQFASQMALDPNVLRDKVVKVQEWIINNTPNGIPALFHEEVLSGVNTFGATVYPQQIGQACSFNTELAELKTLQSSTLMRKLGSAMSLSPMVDVCRTPSFNRLEESYGEDAYLSAMMGTAFARGLQQGDLKKGVGVCTKHYLGYGGGGNADEKELMEEILLPHETIIRTAGSKVVMTGYHAVHDTNCVANPYIIQDILRDYVGFDGMMVSDYGSIKQIPDMTPLEQCAAAINAGNDVDFPNGYNYAYLPEAIEKGLVKPETMERAVKNVLKYKFRAGLFDKDRYLYSNENIVMDTPEERQTAYDIASQSIVLLENNGILPLNQKSKVFVTGPNANSMWAMCGDYTFPAMNYFWKMQDSDGENPHIVKLLEAMQNRKPGNIEISYSRGCDWTEDVETKNSQSGDERARTNKRLQRKVDSGEIADPKEALKLAKQSDIIVAAMGENVMLCGENRDREGLRLPGSQEDYVKALIETGKPVILVVFGGRAQVISEIADKCAAVIQAWYPGEEGGNAVADILYGKISPSAKLSVSYPNTEVYEPISYNYADTIDSRVEWPFGFGLSYTTFEYSNLSATPEAKTSDEAINVSFDVKNTGEVTADEIAQLYLSPTTEGQNIRLIQLQGFKRVHLEPGETKTVNIKMYLDQFGYYSNNGKRQWNIDPGTFAIKIGASSADIKLTQNVTISGDKITKKLRDHYFSE